MTALNSRLDVEGRPGGPLMTVTYCLTDVATGAWALVDPTYETEETWRDRLKEDAPPALILITHAHFDHVAGLAAVRRIYPAVPVWVHPDGREMVTDAEKNGAGWTGFEYTSSAATHFYQGGDEVTLGETKIKVIEAPGHCPGSVVLYAEGQLVAGDVLFAGSVGRWDLPGADYDTLSASIREKVMTLPDETRVYPGHGPATTIGQERRTNFIVQRMLAGEAYE